MCVLVHACVHVRWHACVCDVFAIYDNKSWPRLIMIIIKIIILYFIQIRDTDDFPLATGTRLVRLIMLVFFTKVVKMLHTYFVYNNNNNVRASGDDLLSTWPAAAREVWRLVNLECGNHRRAGTRAVQDHRRHFTTRCRRRLNTEMQLAVANPLQSAARFREELQRMQVEGHVALEPLLAGHRNRWFADRHWGRATRRNAFPE